MGVPAGTLLPSDLLPRISCRTTCPIQLTSFVGRERELAELREALAATRLLTLTGAGGCGKTRLACRSRSEPWTRFPDGVWWVELAPLADERWSAPTVAEALGVRPLPGMTELQAAGAYLASRRALLVLDNCEHLLGLRRGWPRRCCRRCPDVVVLATSRAPLGVAGETDWRVPSLSLPGPRRRAAARLGRYRTRWGCSSSGRARRVPDFALTDENAESVAADLPASWTACRWRSSWRPRACGCSRREQIATRARRTASGC